MVADRLGLILSELSSLIHVPNLQPDQNNTCVLALSSGIRVQIELDKSEEHLIVGIIIGDVPAGAYRSRIFRRALQINGLPPPRFGVLAYSRQANELILFDKLKIGRLTASDIASLLEMMVPKAQMWIDALETGKLPETPAERAKPEESGDIFGLKH